MRGADITRAGREAVCAHPAGNNQLPRDAVVHPAGSPRVRPLVTKLKLLLPEERQSSAAIIEVTPAPCPGTARRSQPFAPR